MTTPTDQIIRKTVSLPASLWEALGNYRFLRRFPTETAAVANVIARGLKAGATLGAIADIATGRRNGHGRFSLAINKTFGDNPSVLELVQNEVRNSSIERGLTLTHPQIDIIALQIYQAAERVSGGQAASGQAAILDIAIEELIDWALRSA